MEKYHLWLTFEASASSHLKSHYKTFIFKALYPRSVFYFLGRDETQQGITQKCKLIGFELTKEKKFYDDGFFLYKILKWFYYMKSQFTTGEQWRFQ